MGVTLPYLGGKAYSEYHRSGNFFPYFSMLEGGERVKERTFINFLLHANDFAHPFYNGLHFWGRDLTQKIFFKLTHSILESDIRKIEYNSFKN